MAFNTYVFIFAFLPPFLLACFTLGRRGLRVRKALIILGSAVFYLAGGWQSAAVLAVSLAVNYALALLLRGKPGKRGPLVLGLLFNAGLLFGFKYLDFAADSLRLFAGESPARLNLWMPLGISFFTFQQIMYLVSVKRGDIEVQLSDYLAFVLFFPKLIMGPLMEPKEFLAQLNDSSRVRPDWGNLAAGLKLFSLGLGIFSVVGVSMAYTAQPDGGAFLAVFVGVLTGVGGGVMRDVMAGDMPYIFVRHIYACASLAGALLCALSWHALGQVPAMVAGAATVVVIRILSATFKWNLPKAD